MPSAYVKFDIHFSLKMMRLFQIITGSVLIDWRDAIDSGRTLQCKKMNCQVESTICIPDCALNWYYLLYFCLIRLRWGEKDLMVVKRKFFRPDGNKHIERLFELTQSWIILIGIYYSSVSEHKKTGFSSWRFDFLRWSFSFDYTNSKSPLLWYFTVAAHMQYRILHNKTFPLREKKSLNKSGFIF